MMEVKEISFLDRMDIFMQYPRQEYFYRGNTVKMLAIYPFEHKISLSYGFTLLSNEFTDVSVIVKPLGRISKKDAEIICAHRYGPLKEGMFWDEDGLMNCAASIIHLIIIGDKVHQKTIDFLREQGYALPHKNWSVEELVEFGIYKLI